MKAIFAVSALAAAISAQAIAADTEATTTFSGSMDAAFSVDLANDATKNVALVEDDDDGEGYEIDMEIAVVNGPFSGSVGIEAYDNDLDGDQSLGDNVKVTVGDLTVTDGKLTFGQVGNLMSTDEYAGEMAEAGTAGVLAGFKYMVMEGMHVQLQNNEAATNAYGSSFGLAAQYTGEADALAYTVEGEFSGSDGAPDSADPSTFVGAAATYTADMFTLDAAVNNYGASTKITEVAVGVSTEVAGATASVVVTDTDLASEVTEDSLFVDADVSYAIDAVTVSAGYFFTSVEEAGDEVTAGVAWEQDALSASADITLAEFDAENAKPLLTELNVTYTSEAGVAYYADYALQAEDTDSATAEKNMLTLGARYSF
jgi:hypothetical protein